MYGPEFVGSPFKGPYQETMKLHQELRRLEGGSTGVSSLAFPWETFKRLTTTSRLSCTASQ